MRPRDSLLDALRTQADAPAARWLDDAVTRGAGGSVSDLLASYTAASTRLGTGLFSSPPPAATLETGSILSFDRWTLADAGRAVLLLTRAGGAQETSLVADEAIACYEQGDAGEQRSWLKAVALLPQPSRFLPLVIDACRTNILPNFEAVACENPYPADYFPERNFNQLVLKALFNSVALARIVGLERRANAELARMARDYAAERQAAGRTVPPDIALATRDVERS